MSVGRVKPDRSLVILTGRHQSSVMPVASNGEVCDSAIFFHDHTARITSNPEIRVAVLEQIINLVVVQTVRVCLVEDGGTDSIETYQTVLRAQPEIAVLGLNHGNNHASRKSLLRTPGVHDEGRVGRGRCARPGWKDKGENAKQPPRALKQPAFLRHV